MDHDAQSDFHVVYEGFDPVEAGMLARLLEVEGITCRHVGTHFPAEIGVGAYGCEQRLEVPTEEVERARELISASVAPPPPDEATDTEG